MKTKNQKNQIAILNDAKNEIENSFKAVNDVELLNDLQHINIDILVKKTALNRSIWKKEVFNAFKSDKTARRKLRNEQFSLCKSFLSSIITKQNEETIFNNAKKLFDFSNNNLVDIANFSNVSEESNKEKREVLNMAYAKLKLFSF